MNINSMILPNFESLIAKQKFINDNDGAVNVGAITDGYHTFDELYEHRCLLFLFAGKQFNFIAGNTWRPAENRHAWCSLYHHDGTNMEGWFIAGIPIDISQTIAELQSGENCKQITYHLPMKYWEKACRWLVQLDKAPEWDGHTSHDVLDRLLSAL